MNSAAAQSCGQDGRLSLSAEPLLRDESKGYQPMLVATPGGHLSQLLALSNRMNIDAAKALWVSCDTAQAASELAGRDVIWAPYTAPRDLVGFGRHARLAARILRRRRISMVITTGASLAPPFLAVARTARIPCHYVESATRTYGPSLSGKIASRIPGVHLYSQYESWSTRRWTFGGSVFDGFATATADADTKIRRVLVTVGSARDFPFQRLIDAARRILPDTCEVTWQIGENDGTGLPGEVHRDLSAADMARVISACDAVISHAGTGSVLSCLQQGIRPVIIPRSPGNAEHVDGHQHNIAEMLLSRDLAVVREPGELTFPDLESARSRRVVPAPPPPFRLRG